MFRLRDLVPVTQQEWGESKLEGTMRDYVKEEGGYAYKFNSPERASVPDRLILLPEVEPFFVEVKAWKKRPTTGQMREVARIILLGSHAYFIDNMEDFKIVIAGARSGNWADPVKRSPQTPTYVKFWAGLTERRARL